MSTGENKPVYYDDDGANDDVDEDDVKKVFKGTRRLKTLFFFSKKFWKQNKGT